MKPAEFTRVKICCIANFGEADLARKYGAAALGLVSEMPSGPGVLSDEEISWLSNFVREEPILLTSRRTASEIFSLLNRAKVRTVQFVNAVAPPEYEILREEFPYILIIQVIHVAGDESLREAAEAAKHADFILLDSGNPHLQVPELGGTGRTHDWSLSAKIRAEIPARLILAGGLTPENVGEAIATVRPYAVDVCSGVRTAGKLDEAKLSSFMAAVKAADAALR